VGGCGVLTTYGCPSDRIDENLGGKRRGETGSCRGFRRGSHRLVRRLNGSWSDSAVLCYESAKATGDGETGREGAKLGHLSSQNDGIHNGRWVDHPGKSWILRGNERQH